MTLRSCSQMLVNPLSRLSFLGESIGFMITMHDVYVPTQIFKIIDEPFLKVCKKVQRSAYLCLSQLLYVSKLHMFADIFIILLSHSSFYQFL